MFRFANPQYLWLLVLVPVFLLLFGWMQRVRRKNLERFGAMETIRELMPEVSLGRVWLKMLLFAGAFALLVFAVARPQLGSKLSERKAEGVEMMLVVDVSNSMLAEDFQPNRLERTKYAINKLFDGMKQDRVGMVVFAGEAQVQLPITSDYRMAKAFTEKISPDLVDVQGTSVGKALDLTLLSFSKQGDQKRSQVMILITDGENHEDDAIAAAERAKELGVKIFTIGIGTPEGAPIEIGGEFIKDENGDMVVTKLNEEMLMEMAQITGGAYVRSTNKDLGLDEILKTINKLEKSEYATVTFSEYNELFEYLLGGALLLLLVEMLLLERRNPLFRHLNIFRETRPKA